MSTLSATYRSRQKVLGYPVDIVDEGLALEVIEEAWRLNRGLHIVTLNAEMVVAAQKDQELDRIVRHAHLIVPDGSGVVWALRLMGHGANRLPGIELAAASLQMAARQNIKVALIGGRKDVLQKNEEMLPSYHHGLQIVAARDGFFSTDEEDEIVDSIAAAEPQLVLVALGVPKQEYFIDKWHHAFPHAVMIGVGGSFDIWAGATKRAPALFRKMHCEWLYRLIKEPWRFNRMMSALPWFAMQVLRQEAQSRLAPPKGHGERSGSSGGSASGSSGSSTRTPKPHDKSKERSKDK